MVSVCLPSEDLLQHLPSYLGFSYLVRGVSLHGCSSKAQPLLLALDEGYLLTTALPDLLPGIALLGPPAPAQPPLFGRGVAPPGCRTWPWMWGNSSWLPPFGHGVLPVSAPDFGRGVAPLRCAQRTGCSCLQICAGIFVMEWYQVLSNILWYQNQIRILQKNRNYRSISLININAKIFNNKY